MAGKTLENFDGTKPIVRDVNRPVVSVMPKPRKPRKTRADLDLDWRNKQINKEHELDGKSKTINLERCFLTKLRVSKEVWEEVRARTIDQLDQEAAMAEARALKSGRSTIMMEDL